MSYTALEKMERENRARYGMFTGPKQPELPAFSDPDGLKFHALHFLHDCCEELGFDPQKEELEKDGVLLGNSVKEGQIPFNMQMDINRLCLETELGKFIDSGTAEDAYTIYYCYLEMFFGHYGKSKKMVELLSEFESNGSSLLMKHRDHYSHSVYVFSLGLAIYHSNELFRKTFNRYYGFPEDENKEAANFFLKYWGMTSLFHDIGYPFELPFEQVMSYFEVDKKKRSEGVPFLAYRDLGSLNRLDEDTKKRFCELYGKDFDTLEELFSHSIAEKLGTVYGFTEEHLTNVLARKPAYPDEFSFFMDHAYFSAARLFQQLESSFGAEGLEKVHVDALTAIILHNSLYKFSIAFYKKEGTKPLRIELHPLAYLLMLCDELQCWDRTAYGRNSRNELHPMAADFDFSASAVTVTYFFDKAESEKIDYYWEQYSNWKDGKTDKEPELKAYSSMAGDRKDFESDIKRIVDTEQIPLTVKVALTENDRTVKHTYLSRSNFLHLYDFAVSLNGRYKYENLESQTPESVMESDFEKLSLEYQLSNINQAKNFGKYLNAIDCFYTDQPVDFGMVTEFNGEQTAIFAPMEHERWVLEHQRMGWISGDLYETIESDLPPSTLREQFRMHKLAMDGELTHERVVKHYLSLPPEVQEKDYAPFNSMLRLIKKYDGLRIYKLDKDDIDINSIAEDKEKKG